MTSSIDGRSFADGQRNAEAKSSIDSERGGERPPVDSRLTPASNSLQSMADVSPLIQRQRSVIQRLFGDKVAQREWDGDESSKIRNWTPVRAPGLNWRWINADRMMYFELENRDPARDTPLLQRLREFEGQRNSYQQWLEMWPKLTQEMSETAVRGIKSGDGAGDPDAFRGYVAEGLRKYDLLKSGVRSLPQIEKEARAKAFSEKYRSNYTGRVPTPDDGSRVLKSVAIGSPYDLKGGANANEGQYVTRVDRQEGTLVADQSYAWRKGDEGAGEPFNTSEVLYQQWRTVGEGAKPAASGAASPDQEATLKLFSSAHVAGTGIPVVKAVKAWALKEGRDMRKTLELTPRDAGFFALLAAANSQAGVFLILDHGKDLGIDDIAELHLTPGESISVVFEPG